MVTEQEVSSRKRLAYLALHFSLNLVLTLSNKAILGNAHFPWLLTTLHTLSTTIGCYLTYGVRSLELTKLNIKENMTLVAFSVLFTLNVAMSNVSLDLISVPLHQVLRSTCPIVTILLTRLLYKRTYPTSTYLSMIPLISGVALATMGDYYCTIAGFGAAAVGVALASIKTVATNRLLTGSLKLSSLELLLRMSPLATIQCVLVAIVSGEAAAARAVVLEAPRMVGMGILVNGVIAFALNITSFQANKVAGPLAMTVCGNLKQALTITLGFLLFQVQAGYMNVLGTAMTVVGAVWYSRVELRERHAKGLPA